MAEINLLPQEPNTEKNYQVLKIQGEIDRDTVADFRESMEKFLAEFQLPNLILDLTELKFINSEGIGYITDVYNRFAALNKKIVIINASPQIIDIFNLVGLNQLIQCMNSEEEAANTF
jgi:anti-anti-sigma factor